MRYSIESDLHLEQHSMISLSALFSFSTFSKCDCFLSLDFCAASLFFSFLIYFLSATFYSVGLLNFSFAFCLLISSFSRLVAVFCSSYSYS